MALNRFLVIFSGALLSILGVAAYNSIPVSASVGFQPVSPEELRMTNEPQAPGAPAIILYRQVDRVDSGTAAHEDNYVRIKVFKEEGRKYADVEIPFLKENGKNITGIR